MELASYRRTVGVNEEAPEGDLLISVAKLLVLKRTPPEARNQQGTAADGWFRRHDFVVVATDSDHAAALEGRRLPRFPTITVFDRGLDDGVDTSADVRRLSRPDHMRE